MSDSNVFFLNVHEAMQRAGINVDEVYRRIGIDPALLLQPGVRIPHEAQAAFWAAVEAVTGDPEIGLHLCPFISPFAGEVVNTLFVNSPTLGSGFIRVQRYIRLLSDHMMLQLVDGLPGPQAMIAGRIGNEHTPRHTEITVFYGVMQVVRWATSGRFRPQRLELCCSPSASPEEFEHLFGCPVTFGAAEAHCYFDRAMLDLPLLHADPDVVEMQEAVAQRRMRRVLRQDIVEEVRRMVTSRLDGEALSLTAIARLLQRSPRRLRSELLDAGTSFNDILSEARQSLAKRLLGGSTLPVEQVGHRVGFSERSAFFRAFKRWTGLTPMQYRQRRQDDGENDVEK